MAEAQEKMGEMEVELEDLRPLADVARRLDAERSAEKVRKLGHEPKGDSGPAIRAAAVEALLPSVLARHPAGSPARAVAVDAAFEVLCSRGPAEVTTAQAPKTGERPLVALDSTPAPKSTQAVRGRFNAEI